jgi:hypothetical protein
MAPHTLAGLEVDAACRRLRELLHIPHHLLGLGSPVYIQLLQQVGETMRSHVYVCMLSANTPYIIDIRIAPVRNSVEKKYAAYTYRSV